MLSLLEVLDLVGRMKHPRYRALILLSVFDTLRWCEVTALRRRDLAPDESWVRVAGAFVKLSGKGLDLWAARGSGELAHERAAGRYPTGDRRAPAIALALLWPCAAARDGRSRPQEER